MRTSASIDGSTTATSRSATRSATAAITAAAVLSAGANASARGAAPRRACVVGGAKREGLPQAARLDGDVVHPGQAGERRGGLGEVPHHLPCATEAGPERGEVVVDEHPPAVDHHDTAAEPLDVGQVVRGEQQCDGAAGDQVGEERPQPLLARQVQADRRLVEHQQLRPVQQRRRHLAAHALAQRQLAHRRREERGHVEQLDALVEALLVGHPGDGAVQGEALAQRQVPPQVAALPEHDADAPGQVATLAHRVQTAHPGPAHGRHEHAGQHLDRGGLARPVRAEEADGLARRDGERHALDGRHPLAPSHHERPGQALRLDDHDPVPW